MSMVMVMCLYTSYPIVKPKMETVIVNRGFLSVGHQQVKRSASWRRLKTFKVAQVRIAKANRRWYVGSCKYKIIKNLRKSLELSTFYYIFANVL